MALGPFTEKHSFYYVTQPNLLCRALLSKLKGLIHLAANGDLILEFPDQPESYLLCSLQSVFDIEEEELQQKSPNLMEVPENLWATSNTDFGRIKSAESIKIQIDIPLPKLPQHPLKPEAMQGHIPTVEDLIAQGLIISCTCPPVTCQFFLSGNLMGGDGDLSRT